MIILLPLLLSLVFYLLKENYNYIILGIIYILLLLMNYIIMYNIVNIEILSLILITLLVLYWFNLSNDMISNKDNAYELLGAIFIIGSYLALMSTSLIPLFISVEILTFTIMILINLYIQDQYPGILYYLFSGIFSALFILSLGLIYFGSTIAYKLLLIVFIAKIGLAPFHILLPRLYQNLSIQWIFIIDIPYKIVLFLILYKLNIINQFSIGSINITPIIILSILIGAIGSLRYKNLLSIGIYSSIYHYSLILITLENNNLDYFYYYILMYSLITLLYFYLITSYSINYRINQFYYFILWFLLIMNLIGIPPLSGFYIKFYPLYLSILNHNFVLFIVISIGLLLLTYTYLRILIIMMIGKENDIIINNKSSFYSHLISTIIIFISFTPLLFFI